MANADSGIAGDVRAIISKGWSARLSSDEGPDVEMPPECYQVRYKFFHNRLSLQVNVPRLSGRQNTARVSHCTKFLPCALIHSSF
jgi:hypothetical protein